jgi:hypothetical protein
MLRKDVFLTLGYRQRNIAIENRGKGPGKRALPLERGKDRGWELRIG